MSSTQSPTGNRQFTVLGGGPAGLYCALLLKKARPEWCVKVIERNPPDVTYGWGVVFSDRTLQAFQTADYPTYTAITEQFVIWDAIDVRYRGEVIRCGGHVIAAIERRRLLNILQARCTELGVEISFVQEIADPLQLPYSDLLIAADGVNSLVRRTYDAEFAPETKMGRARYIWLGANKTLDAFNFIFHETEHGLFQVHAYPFNGTSSTFIVECAEDVWQRAGLDQADEAASLDFCQSLLAPDLGGAELLSNNSKWISFPALKTKRWHAALPTADGVAAQRVVLLGDAAHTAHFSIGSGTKLAMEDAIALAEALDSHPDIEAALGTYELERRPVIETFQRAASESQVYFETLKRYLRLPPMQFAFQLLTRSGRISYDDLRFRDARFGDAVDAWFGWEGHARSDGGTVSRTTRSVAQPPTRFAPSPMFTPLKLRDVRLPNRLARSVEVAAQDGLPSIDSVEPLMGYGLALVQDCAVDAGGRISPLSSGMYSDAHGEAWAEWASRVRTSSGPMLALQLSHAGRRGATEPRTWGLDRPLRQGGWPLLSASPLPYTLRSQTPKEIDRNDMDTVRDRFVQAAVLADRAGFDALFLPMAHGYLLASFLSSLTNLRGDEYGGDLDARAAYPLQVFDAVRAVWPAGKPLAVSINAEDNLKGGSTIKDAVLLARLLKERGCDLIHVLAGHSVPGADLPYGRGFLTPLSDRIRNETGIPTVVGGYLTTGNDANTVLAAGRSDICFMSDYR